MQTAYQTENRLIQLNGGCCLDTKIKNFWSNLLKFFHDLLFSIP